MHDILVAPYELVAGVASQYISWHQHARTGRSDEALQLQATLLIISHRTRLSRLQSMRAIPILISVSRQSRGADITCEFESRNFIQPVSAYRLAQSVEATKFWSRYLQT